MKQFRGPLFIVAFCFLIALRDVLTEQLLGKGTRPTLMLLIWCIECSVLAWAFRSFRKKKVGFVERFLQLTRRRQLNFLYLGLATWIVYIATVNGIDKLTSPAFNLVEYSTLPLFTLFMASRMNKEHIYVHRIVGVIFSVLGIAFLLLVLLSESDKQPHWHIFWISLALVSALFTAYCSSIQSKLIKDDLTPNEVLLYRFPIPAILMIIWFSYEKFFLESPEFPVNVFLGDVLWLLLIGAVTVFLPLWFLCQAFVRSSVGELASYIFLIAVFTFVLQPLFVPQPFSPLQHWEFWCSVILFLIGYLIAQILLKRQKKLDKKDAENPGKKE